MYTSKMEREFLVSVGSHNNALEEIEREQRVAAIEPFGFKGSSEKRKEIRTPCWTC